MVAARSGGALAQPSAVASGVWGSEGATRPGTFSWVDLATTDAAAAKTFYVGLFGWELEDTEADGGALYTVCRLSGDAVSGMYEIAGDVPATSVAPSWLSYVSVADADCTAARVKQLGGRIVHYAFDVGNVGRMAVLEDPQGAVFAVWQPRTRIGAERVNDIGCLCMNELITTDHHLSAAAPEVALDHGPRR